MFGFVKKMFSKEEVPSMFTTIKSDNDFLYTTRTINKHKVKIFANTADLIEQEIDATVVAAQVLDYRVEFGNCKFPKKQDGEIQILFKKDIYDKKPNYTLTLKFTPDRKLKDIVYSDDTYIYYENDFKGGQAITVLANGLRGLL